MFERYSEKSRRVVFFARYEAAQLGGRAIEPEHLLLAIIKEDPLLAQGVLPGGEDGGAEIRKRIEAAMGHEPKAGASVDLPVSSSGKKVMRIAADEAEKAGDQLIEPKHLMLGLLLDEGSRSSEILRQNGVTAELILQNSLESSQAPGGKKESEAARILSQLSVLIELLIKQGIFSREDLAEELANRYILPDLHATLNSLLVMLLRKGVINEDDRRNIAGFSGR